MSALAHVRERHVTYHMKKKKPVRRAGYLSKKPTGAIFDSLQKLRVKKKNTDNESESDTERLTKSERRKRTSPGGIAPLGWRRGGC